MCASAFVAVPVPLTASRGLVTLGHATPGDGPGSEASNKQTAPARVMGGTTTLDWSEISAEFPTLSRKTYLNSCSLGLLSNRSRAALNRYMDLWAEKGAAAWYVEWMAEIGAVRDEFAALINASPSEISVLPSISSALAAIASSLDLGEGDRVVTTVLDFPTVAHHFLAKGRQGVETVIIPTHDGVRIDLDQFEAAISDRTVLVATSRVYFTSGYIQDIESVAALAHAKGALFFLDDYQATGQLPIDVKDMGVDILASGGLKWLLGGPGIAYMYVRGDLIGQLAPTVAGWFGNRNQFDFNPNEMVFRDDAARFETGTPSVAAIYTGAEGLRIVNELGPEAIRERTSELTSRLVMGLKEDGFTLRSPEVAKKHASITMIELDDPGAVVQALAERDIVVDSRPGAVRISPYFYNTLDEIDAVVAALRDVRG